MSGFDSANLSNAPGQRGVATPTTFTHVLGGQVNAGGPIANFTLDMWGNIYTESTAIGYLNFPGTTHVSTWTSDNQTISTGWTPTSAATLGATSGYNIRVGAGIGGSQSLTVAGPATSLGPFNGGGTVYQMASNSLTGGLTVQSGATYNVNDPASPGGNIAPAGVSSTVSISGTMNLASNTPGNITGNWTIGSGGVLNITGGLGDFRPFSGNTVTNNGTINIGRNDYGGSSTGTVYQTWNQLSFAGTGNINVLVGNAFQIDTSVRPSAASATQVVTLNGLGPIPYVGTFGNTMNNGVSLFLDNGGTANAVNNPIVLTAGTVSSIAAYATNNVSQTGVISGSGGTYFSGYNGGNIYVGGTNTYTGITYIGNGGSGGGSNNGWVVFNNASGSSAKFSSKVVMNSGAAGLIISNNQTIQSLDSINATGQVNLGNGTLTIANNGTTTVPNPITATGGLNLQAGNLTLTGTNTYTGTTVTSSGATLSYGTTTGTTGTAQSSTQTVSGTLNINSGHTGPTYVGVTSGITTTSGGVVNYNGNPTTRFSYISSQLTSLVASSTANINNSSVAFNGSAINGTVNINAGSNYYASGTTTGSGTIVVNSTGWVDSSSYNHCPIEFANGITNTQKIQANNAFCMQGYAGAANSATFSGGMSGVGDFTFNPNNTSAVLTLSGNGSFYTGAVFVNGGNLIGNNTNTFLNSLITVNNSATYTAQVAQSIGGIAAVSTSAKIALSASVSLAGNYTSTFAGVISGTGGINVNGTTNLSLTNVNTLTGVTNVAATASISGGQLTTGKVAGLTMSSASSRIVTNVLSATSVSKLSCNAFTTSAGPGFTLDVVGGALNVGTYPVLSTTSQSPTIPTPTIGANSTGRRVTTSWAANVMYISVSEYDGTLTNATADTTSRIVVGASNQTISMVITPTAGTNGWVNLSGSSMAFSDANVQFVSWASNSDINVSIGTPFTVNVVVTHTGTVAVQGTATATLLVNGA